MTTVRSALRIKCESDRSAADTALLAMPRKVVIQGVLPKDDAELPAYASSPPIIAMVACWRNDQPGGFTLSVQTDWRRQYARREFLGAVNAAAPKPLEREVISDGFYKDDLGSIPYGFLPLDLPETPDGKIEKPVVAQGMGLLDEMGLKIARKEPISEQEFHTAFSLIAALEQDGSIPTDDHNGALFFRVLHEDGSHVELRGSCDDGPSVSRADRTVIVTAARTLDGKRSILENASPTDEELFSTVSPYAVDPDEQFCLDEDPGGKTSPESYWIEQQSFFFQPDGHPSRAAGFAEGYLDLHVSREKLQRYDSISEMNMLGVAA